MTPRCRLHLYTTGRRFPSADGLSLGKVSSHPLPGIGLSITPPSTSRDTGWGRHHNDHRPRGHPRNHNRKGPFYSPTGEIYLNSNIITNTANAVKGICQKKKKVNGKLTPRKIKSYLMCNFLLDYADYGLSYPHALRATKEAMPQPVQENHPR